MAVHLPNQHTISFVPPKPNSNSNPANTNLTNTTDPITERRQQINQRLEKNSDTTLMAWFKLNRADPDARQYLYREIPKYYTYIKRTHTWRRRRFPNLTIVGRIYSVHCRDQEKFALRQLLNHIRGAQSSDELKHFNDQIYPTFRVACIARGLIENPQEALNCINEAYSILTNPNHFREFFAQYLINLFTRLRSYLACHQRKFIKRYSSQNSNCSKRQFFRFYRGHFSFRTLENNRNT